MGGFVMKSKEGKIKVRIGSAEYPMDLLDMKIVGDDGNDYTIRGLFEKIFALEKENDVLNRKLSDSVAVIANAENLISTAHDGLSSQQAQNTTDIQTLKADVKALQDKTKYL
jgi:hypothetical protein